MRNENASIRSSTSPRPTRPSSIFRYAVEPLEKRELLSTISWVNRNITSDSDPNDNRFDNVFGTLANQAIHVIDAAIQAWQRTIASFNYGNGTETYSLTVTMNAPAANGTSSTGGAANGEFTATINNKPSAGGIALGWTSGIAPGTNTAAGWFLDPTPNDSSEFQGTWHNAFARNPTTSLGGADLFSVTLHELGHCIGLGSTTQTRAVSFDTNSTDNVFSPPSDPPSTLWAYNGNGSLWTEWDSGGATNNGPSNKGGPQHFAPIGTSAVVNGTTRVGAVALMNFTNRAIISDLEADCARLAYGYSINKPSEVGTTYDQLDADGTLRIDTSSLTINSFDSDDTIVVNSGNGFVTVDITPTRRVATIDPLGTISSYFIASQVQRITIKTGGGNDLIRLESNNGKPCDVSAGPGNDFIDLAFTSGNLFNLSGNTSISGDDGTDTVHTYDRSVTSAQTYNITNLRFDRPGWGGYSYDIETENHELTTGTGADTVNIQSVAGGRPVVVASAGGADTVNVGNATNGLGSVNADVQVQNDPALTTLNINNGPDSAAHTWNVDGFGNFGYLIGMSNGTIYWDNADIASINLTCGSGVDTGQFVISTETFNLNNAGGDDFIRVGVPAAAGTSLLSGQITIDNAPAHTTLTIDDNGNSQIRNIIVDEAGGYNTVTGMGAVFIRFDSLDVSSATIVTGSGNDTVSIPRNDEILNIVNFGGLDGVTIGNATNGVQSITGAVSISGPFGPSLVTVNNGPDTTARTATLQNVTISGNVYSEWTGLAPAAIRYRDQLIATVTFGSAADTIAVRQTQGDLNLTSTGGVDNYTFGGAANGAQGVLGEITLINPSDHNVITIDDAASTASRNAILDDTLLAGVPYGRLTGFAPANFNWKYNDTTAVNIIHGSAADTLTVFRHQKPLSIQGTSGDDIVNLGGGPSGMNGLTGAITVQNTSGATTLVLNDVNDTDSSNIEHTLTSSINGRVTGMSPNPIDYRVGQVNNVRLRTSQGGFSNRVDITETSSLTRVFYDPGENFEILTVNGDLTGSASLHTDRSVTPRFVDIGSGGAINQLPGGNVFRSESLSMSLNASFDISDGAMIFDFNEGNPLDGIREQIIQGYNGGNWQGFGIRSSTAATTPGGAVGYANAADLFSSFPAMFAGQSVDETTSLVRYTPGGNANLDRQVNTLDFNLLAGNFGSEGAVFSQGDFNYSGEVDSVDFGILVSQYGKTLPTASATAAPSPSQAPSVFGGIPVIDPDDDPILMVA